MKSVVYFVALILGCYGQGFQGYHYPRPSCPLPLPVTYTDVSTVTEVYSTEATVYQTQILTNSVSYPVYITSTVSTERLVTAYSTMVYPVTQYQTETRTVFIQPSTVVSTVVSTVTVCSAIADDSAKEVNNAYLPPVDSAQSGQTSVVDDYKQNVDNTYLPPTGGNYANSGSFANSGSDSGAGNSINLGLNYPGVASDDYKRSTIRLNPFDSRQARYALNLGALPPSF